MTPQNGIYRIRNAALNVAFQLLYTRLGFLHEATGRFVTGAAWSARRQHVLPAGPPATVLDVGCGEGRLLTSLTTAGYFAFGIEPSRQMAARASRHNVRVVQSVSQALPVQTRTVDHVVATYPGPWIADSRTWDEIARVTRPGASIAILLGGDYERGRWAFVRSRLLRLAYGRQPSTEAMPELGHPAIDGGYHLVSDNWGTAILWCGRRRDVPDTPTEATAS